VRNVERVAEVLQLVGAMRVDELIDRFADDAVMELPFAPGRMAKEFVGKEEIGAFQRSARDAFSEFAVTVDAVHETGDPHVVVAEFGSDAVVRENGRPYRNRYVAVFTFDDAGRLTRWREYYDASVVVEAFRP
jgi:ketosteroid isomerase-like protein